MCDSPLSGVTVLSLSASDADDSPDNKRIEFFIVGGNEDRESVDTYQLTIMAADGGTPSRNTTTLVSFPLLSFPLLSFPSGLSLHPSALSLSTPAKSLSTFCSVPLHPC